MSFCLLLLFWLSNQIMKVGVPSLPFIANQAARTNNCFLFLFPSSLHSSLLPFFFIIIIYYLLLLLLLLFTLEE